MKIIRIEAKPLKLELDQPIVTSIGTVNFCETIIVQICTDSGICGYGEGAGISFVTGETTRSMLEVVDIISKNLIGKNTLSIDAIHKSMNQDIVGNYSAKAAIDIALYDILGKMIDQPLYKVLGGESNKVTTDMTIGIDEPEKMMVVARRIVDKGFNYLKVKAGRNPKDDIKAIKLIRNEVGPNVHIKVDANQGWSVGDSLLVMNAFSNYGVDAIEQPIAAWDLDGLSYLRKNSPIKIMADESCFTPHDAINLVKKEAVDIINIKLMKSGGIYDAIKINTISEAAGIKCMLGCMMESKIGISAAASLLSSRSNFSYGDLDSYFYIKDNDIISGGFEVVGENLILSDSPGLGIEVDFDSI